METYPDRPRTLKRLKREAKKLAKEQGLAHMEALDVIARSHGWFNYNAARRELPED